MHIRINWPILRLGVPEDFSNAESLTIHLSRVNNNNVKTFIPDTHMSIAGNVVSFIVTDEMQKSLTSGEYKATISYRKVSTFYSVDIEASRKSMEAETGIEVAGILGTPAIKELGMVIDLRRGIVTLKPE